MATREEILAAVLEHDLIAIVRLNDGANLQAAAQAIHAGGIRVIEFTMNYAGRARCHRRVPGRAAGRNHRRGYGTERRASEGGDGSRCADYRVAGHEA